MIHVNKSVREEGTLFDRVAAYLSLVELYQASSVADFREHRAEIIPTSRKFGWVKKYNGLAVVNLDFRPIYRAIDSETGELTDLRWDCLEVGLSFLDQREKAALGGRARLENVALLYNPAEDCVALLGFIIKRYSDPSKEQARQEEISNGLAVT